MTAKKKKETIFEEIIIKSVSKALQDNINEEKYGLYELKDDATCLVKESKYWIVGYYHNGCFVCKTKCETLLQAVLLFFHHINDDRDVLRKLESDFVFYSAGLIAE